jgi:outer membrane lipoprotein SlyB
MTMQKFAFAILAATLSAGALAQYDGPERSYKQKPEPLSLETCQRCGTVESVREEKRKGEANGAGMVGGAVIGGLLGNQIGKGSGRAVATVGGAVAGGYVGNEVQKNANSRMVWVTEVRMKDGSLRTFEQDGRPRWRSGSIVRVRNNSLSF